MNLCSEKNTNNRFLNGQLLVKTNLTLPNQLWIYKTKNNWLNILSWSPLSVSKQKSQWTPGYKVWHVQGNIYNKHDT